MMFRLPPDGVLQKMAEHYGEDREENEMDEYEANEFDWQDPG